MQDARERLLSLYRPAIPWAEPVCLVKSYRDLPCEESLSGRHLSIANFEIEHLIGEGNYSQVMLAKLKPTQACTRRAGALRDAPFGRHLLRTAIGSHARRPMMWMRWLSPNAPRAAQEKFALKVVDRSKANRHKKLDEVVVEKWVLANLSHPSIIRIYQTFQDRAAMYLVLEHVPGGELWAVSHGKGIRPSLASFYVAQVCPSHPRARARHRSEWRGHVAHRWSRRYSTCTSTVSSTAT